MCFSENFVRKISARKKEAGRNSSNQKNVASFPRFSISPLPQKKSHHKHGIISQTFVYSSVRMWVKNATFFRMAFSEKCFPPLSPLSSHFPSSAAFGNFSRWDAAKIILSERCLRCEIAKWAPLPPKSFNFVFADVNEWSFFSFSTENLSCLFWSLVGVIVGVFWRWMLPLWKMTNFGGGFGCQGKSLHFFC